MASTGESGPSDFGLPQDILNRLPSDPYDQLDVACKITSIALSTRVGDLETESSALRAELALRDAVIADLRSRLDASLSAAEAEKESLVKQNESLSETVKNLSRHVEKLEIFKKTILESFQEDDRSFRRQDDSYYLYGIPQIIAKPTPVEDDASLPLSRSSSIQSELSEMGNPSVANRDAEVQTPDRLRILLSERSSPELTPPESPPSLSASLSSPRSSNIVFLRRPAMSFSNPGSLLTNSTSMSLPSSMETRSQTGRKVNEGREFFRKVRSRLSYEQFGAFLETVKEYNSRKQNKEETLRRASEIFDTENGDLYDAFQGLLTREGNQSR